MGWFRKLTDWAEENDPLFKAGKKAAYGMVKQDSDNMEGIGRAIGWDWLTEEAQRNQKNPGRAVGKAAATAATIYGGGLLGGAGAGAGSAAGNAAGNAAGATVQSGTAGMNGLLAQEAAREAAIQSLSQIPQGLGTATSLGNTGYSLQGGLNAYSGGLLGGEGGLTSQQAKMGMQGLQMMQPEQEQRPMAPPPPPAQPMPQSTFTGYGSDPYGSQSDPFAGMSEEQKRKLLAMLQQQGGMR